LKKVTIQPFLGMMTKVVFNVVCTMMTILHRRRRPSKRFVCYNEVYYYSRLKAAIALLVPINQKMPNRLHQILAVGCMWTTTTTGEEISAAASTMLDGHGKLGHSAAAAVSQSRSSSFSWSHNNCEYNDHYWTTSTSDDGSTDNASTMFPLCVSINDYQHQHHLQHSPDDGCPVMVWKILRFVKLIVVRLAHSYAQRIILFVLPLLLGIFVGFLWGRWGSSKNGIRSAVPSQNKSQSSKTSSPSSSSSSPFPTVASLYHIVLPVVNSFCRLVLKFRPESEPASELQTNEILSSRESTSSTATTMTGSGLDKDSIPRHVAIIMDGNRRCGRARYQNATRGHRDGANQVLQVAKWCIAEQHIQVLTLYAFSTENWNRDPAEIAAIMNMFVEECENVRRQALQLNVRAFVVSSDPMLIPSHVAQGLQRLQDDTAHCTGLQLNICVSYGSRSEIVHACRQVVRDVQDGHLSSSQISEETFARRLLTSHANVDPDILIRTSGETRISNYLLWQIAYAELFFVPQTWPELTQTDFTDILHSYAKERQRRFGR
jgi:undecaprenyl diphosphate synthase